MTDEKGLAKTVLDMGKRIAALEGNAKREKEVLDDLGIAVDRAVDLLNGIMHEVYIHAALGDWIASNLNEEQTAHFYAFLKERGIEVTRAEDQVDCSDTEEPKNH